MENISSTQINESYLQGGLKGVYSLLKARNIEFKKNIIEFGLNTNKRANEDYKSFVNHSELKFHYYSRGVKCRKSGYSYNVLRGIELIVL